MQQQMQPAIEALQGALAELERKVIETKNTINLLCEHAGMPPLYQDVGSVSQATVATIKADSFYGKSVITAAREYLEMRKTANLGPASPREVYEALKKGGFQFASKVEINSISIVRNAMSKASTIFHRLPNGEYGLRIWYPKVKGQKIQDADEDDQDDPLD